MERGREYMLKALQCYLASMKLFKKTGDRAAEGVCLNNIGLLFDPLGDYRRARSYYQASLKVREEIGDWQGQGRMALLVKPLGYSKS